MDEAGAGGAAPAALSGLSACAGMFDHAGGLVQPCFNLLANPHGLCLAHLELSHRPPPALLLFAVARVRMPPASAAQVWSAARQWMCPPCAA